jgi:hypothetical protein
MQVLPVQTAMGAEVSVDVPTATMKPSNQIIAIQKQILPNKLKMGRLFFQGNTPPWSILFIFNPIQILTRL